MTQAWQGPPPHASIMMILLWMVIPIAWLLAFGEPWSSVWQGWQRLQSARERTRWAGWVATVLSIWAAIGGAVALLLGGSLIAGIWIDGAIWHTAVWAIMGQQAIGLILLLWTYVLLVVGVGLLTQSPGWPLAGALGLGYCGTVLLTANPTVLPWFPPLVGLGVPSPAAGHATLLVTGGIYSLIVVGAHWFHWRQRLL